MTRSRCGYRSSNCLDRCRDANFRAPTVKGSRPWIFRVHGAIKMHLTYLLKYLINLYRHGMRVWRVNVHQELRSLTLLSLSPTHDLTSEVWTRQSWLKHGDKTPKDYTISILYQRWASTIKPAKSKQVLDVTVVIRVWYEVRVVVDVNFSIQRFSCFFFV